jgi:hypothetical protein
MYRKNLTKTFVIYCEKEAIGAIFSCCYCKKGSLIEANHVDCELAKCHHLIVYVNECIKLKIGKF